jgi:hypothetical protein
MEGRAGTGEGGAACEDVTEFGQGTERREAALIRLTIDPSPRHLRQTLAAIDRRLAGLEEPTLRRVRLILSEVIGRSSLPVAAGPGPIVMQIDVVSDSIRIELFGPGLALPEPDTGKRGDGRAVFPGWVLADLVDNWGVERRRGEPGIWLLIAREPPAGQ